MNNLIIDTQTKGHKKILSRLKKLKSSIDVQDNGQYRNCPECSQISLTTTKTEKQIDHWLWSNNLDYMGVCNGD